MNRFSFHQRDRIWQQTPTADGHRLDLKGHAYLDNQPTSATTFTATLSTAHSADALIALLQRMNGFYAWVEEAPGGVRAAVDHIRSYPLFYALKNGDFFLSDDAEWVRQQAGDEEMDPIAREEFLLAGYVTGSDTLFPIVKQLQAGECLIAHQTETGIRVDTHRYYRFLHQEPHTYSEPALRAELEQVTIRAMQRLIEHANGRQIVIPLSGGYDSRLIASMLKKLGYTNVLCFTYGVPGNTESQYSKQVADSLGFTWEFVEYSKELWRKEWNTSEAKAYRQMASGHVSLPHVQDWLAVKKLVVEEKIDKEAIFVPGHTGDFVAGGHIPDFVFQKKRHTHRSLIDSLIANHLSNCPKRNMQLADLSCLTERIVSRIEIPFDGSDIGFANLYEAWDCQERQAKYIVNSVRVYDQFAHEWWLPLWDLEFVRFWEAVPLALRQKRIWLKTWIQHQYAEASGNCVSLQMGNAGDARSASLLITAAKKIAPMLPGTLVALLKKLRQKKIYSNHFLAFEGLISDDQFIKYSSTGHNIIGMYSDVQINEKW